MTHTEIVQRLYAAFRDGDAETLFSLISADVVIEQSMELPWGGCYSGHEGFRQFFATLKTHVTPQLTFERFIDAGNHVAAVGWTRGIVIGTDRTFDAAVVHIWQIADGKVTRFLPYVDNPVMLKALIG